MNATLRTLLVATLAAAVAACATRGGPAGPLAPPFADDAAELPGIAGLAAPALRTAYGTPAFVRKDGRYEMWRYDGASCKAFFFLYPDGAALAVRHAETLPRGKQWAADPKCLNGLRVAASPPVS